MADMYTKMNACRAYLYATAQAADKGIVSNKVSKNGKFVFWNSLFNKE
jgi:hypothetical protein